MALHDYCFWLDGESSIDHGISLQEPLVFTKPSRRVSTITIPGRNGDLHKSEDAFESVTATASCFVLSENAEEAMGEAANWLLDPAGIRRLETPEDTDVYRLVTIYGGFNTDPRLNRLGVFSVSITSRPERFLKIGEYAVGLMNGQDLYNPGMPAKPLLEITGAGEGTLTVAGVNIDLLDIPGTLLIDCDSMNAYNAGGYQNASIHTPQGFPVLPRGSSVVRWSGGVTAVKITPRWWML